MESLQKCKLLFLNCGEFLFHQHSRNSSLYVLLEGKLQVDSFDLEGNQAVFAFEQPISLLGDLELFSGTRNVSNVRAQTDCLLLEFSSRWLASYGHDSPDFLRFVIRHLQTKLADFSGLKVMARAPAEYRIARYVQHRMQLEGLQFQLERREAIAAMLGLSVRHLNRVFKSLQAAGALRVKNKQLTIDQPQLLQQFLSERT